MVLRGSFFKPFAGLLEVLGNAFAIFIQVADPVLGISVASLGGFLEPFSGFGVVFENASTLYIYMTPRFAWAMTKPCSAAF